MKYYLFIASVFVMIFLFVGYLLSDQLYYVNIVSHAKLKNPMDVYKWVQDNNPSAINTKTSPAPYVSPKFNMINQRSLYCDESAIVMATLNHQIGYKTRLINLIGMDGIAHHTILEVYENNSWKKYDHFNDKINLSYQKLAGYPLLRANVNPYPKFYNFVVNNNYFIKKLAFLIRGIQEPD